MSTAGAIGGINVTVTQMEPADQVIKFLSENKIQKTVIDEIIERGFDSLEALSLMDPEDIKTQKIPIGQRKLLLHVIKALATSTNEHNNPTGNQAGTSAQPVTTPVTENLASATASGNDTGSGGRDIYQETLLNSLLSQQSQLSARENISPSGLHPTFSAAELSQPTWRDPQIHIATATDTSGGSPVTPVVSQSTSRRVQPQQCLSTTLDKEVQMYRSNSFAASTSRTYSAHILTYARFCKDIDIALVPISQKDLGRYIAYLSRKLSFTSVRQYLNAVRLLHLEAGLVNPLEGNWYISSILKGVRRVKGDNASQKLPITLDILKNVFLTLNLSSSFDRAFWTACLVGFFSFFRKSNLLVQSHVLFDPAKHLCGNDVEFTPEGATLAVRWSKVIQFRERVLYIPLPKIKDSPFCPSTALLRTSLENQPCPRPAPLIRYCLQGASNVPLTYKDFTDKLRSCLTACGYQASLYSGHSFRRGGASFALEIGLPVDLIKLQGDWNSNAYERYLHPSLNLRRKVALEMGSSTSKYFCIN